MQTEPGTLPHSEVSGRRKGQPRDQEERPRSHPTKATHQKFVPSKVWNGAPPAAHPSKWMDSHLTRSALVCSAQPRAAALLGASYVS